MRALISRRLPWGSFVDKGLLPPPDTTPLTGPQRLLGSLQQAREALESLDHEASGALGLGSGTDAPPLPMRAVPKKPTSKDIMQKDRLRITPVAKKVLEEASKRNHRKLQITGHQVLAQIFTLDHQILRQCCRALSA